MQASSTWQDDPWGTLTRWRREPEGKLTIYGSTVLAFGVLIHLLLSQALLPKPADVHIPEVSYETIGTIKVPCRIGDKRYLYGFHIVGWLDPPRLLNGVRILGWIESQRISGWICRDLGGPWRWDYDVEQGITRTP